jgi:RimJ/RimL family protein N-acetyltransferase
MHIKIREFDETEKEGLSEFLTGERWEFHSTPQITKEKVTVQLQNGYFTGRGIKTFVITEESSAAIGIIRLFDLGTDAASTETPLFDIKISSRFRGKGIGEFAVNWLKNFVFTNFPAKNRFEATTRADNVSMRRVLEKCGFVKEAHYRKAWPDVNGNKYDCAGYAILREDWESGNLTPVNFHD